MVVLTAFPKLSFIPCIVENIEAYGVTCDFIFYWFYLWAARAFVGHTNMGVKVIDWVDVMSLFFYPPGR